jgi:hypothetical protein
MIGGANKWTNWVREWAEKNDVTYSCAVSIPKCNEEYHAHYGTRPSKKTLERQQARKDATTGKKQTKAQASLAEMGKVAKAKVAVASAVAEKIKKRRGRPPKVAEPEEEYVLTPTKGPKKRMAPPTTPPPISKAQVEAVKAKMAEPEDSKAKKAQANRDRMAKLRAERKAQGLSATGKTKMGKDNITLEVMEVAEPTQSTKQGFSQKTIDEVKSALLARVAEAKAIPQQATASPTLVPTAPKEKKPRKPRAKKVKEVKTSFEPFGSGFQSDSDMEGGAVCGPCLEDYDMIIQHLLSHITDPNEPVDGKDYDQAIHFIKRIRAMKGGVLQLMKQKDTAYPTLGGMMRQRATGLFRRKGGAMSGGVGTDDEGETDHEDNSDDEEEDNPLAHPHFWNGHEFVPVPNMAPPAGLEGDEILEGEGLRRRRMRGGMDRTPRPDGNGRKFNYSEHTAKLQALKASRVARVKYLKQLRKELFDRGSYGSDLEKINKEIDQIEKLLGIEIGAIPPDFVDVDDEDWDAPPKPKQGGAPDKKGKGWEEKPASSGNAFLDTITAVGHDLGKAHPAGKYVNPFDAGFKFGEKVVAPALMKTKLGNPHTGIFSKKFWTIKKKHH